MSTRTKRQIQLEDELQAAGDKIAGETYGALPIDLKKLEALIGARREPDPLLLGLIEVINRLGKRIEEQDAKIISAERMARTAGKRN